MKHEKNELIDASEDSDAAGIISEGAGGKGTENTCQ